MLFVGYEESTFIIGCIVFDVSSLYACADENVMSVIFVLELEVLMILVKVVELV